MVSRRGGIAIVQDIQGKAVEAPTDQPYPRAPCAHVTARACYVWQEPLVNKTYRRTWQICACRACRLWLRESMCDDVRHNLVQGLKVQTVANRMGKEPGPGIFP
jgi:hypothetical protein